MQVFLHILLQTMFGSIGFFFGGDDDAIREGRASGVPVLQFLILSTFLMSLYLISKSAKQRIVIDHCRPILALCLLAFVSTVWAFDPSLTSRKAFALTSATLFGIALVASLGPTKAIGLFGRGLVVTCVLSVIAVVVYPTQAIHQLADGYELKHEGLWRGVVGHKVSLGMFAGLTLAMLLAHGKVVFKQSAATLAAAGVALLCLLGSGSATGIGLVLGYWGLFAAGRYMATVTPAKRQRLVRLLVGSLLLFGYLMSNGTMDRWAELLGRSADLTGRAQFWPLIATFVDTHSPILGYGYASGFRLLGPLLKASGFNLGEAHNGYLEMLVAFGRIGSALVVGVFIWYFLRGYKLLNDAGKKVAPHLLFPSAAIGTLLIVSYVESVILMPTGIWTVLFPLAAAVVVFAEQEQATGQSAPQGRVRRQRQGYRAAA